jgi:hypothetical protein
MCWKEGLEDAGSELEKSALVGRRSSKSAGKRRALAQGGIINPERNNGESSNRSPRRRAIQGEAEMAFVNEYIPEADYEKYDLRKICGEHNLKSLRGRMYSRDWTIDRERDAFLIQVWSHHEAKFEGYAFYWKGQWIFFEMATIDGEIKRDVGSCRILFHVKKFSVPQCAESRREELLADFQAAVTASLGGVTCDYTHRSATIEFIGE